MFRVFIALIFSSLLIFPTAPSFAGNRGLMGALLGAGAGAAIGHSVNRRGGSGKGAAIGAIGGYLIGQQMDKAEARDATPPPQAAPRTVAQHNCQTVLSDTDYAARESDIEKRILLLQKANNTCPNSARIHNDLGVAYYQRGNTYDHDRARMELKEALRIDPNYTVAQRNLNSL